MRTFARRVRRAISCAWLLPSSSDDVTTDDGGHVGEAGRSDEAPDVEMRYNVDVRGVDESEIALTALSLVQPHSVVHYVHHLLSHLSRILAASYYWGRIDRCYAERLLDNKPEGTFLLRDSVHHQYLFSLSFRRFGRTLHARIEQAHHQFGLDILDSTIFSAPTIPEVIEHYSEPSRCMFFEPQLTKPLSRNYVFSLKELSRAALVSAVSYDKVAELPLPRELVHYVREYYYRQALRVSAAHARSTEDDPSTS